MPSPFVTVTARHVALSAGARLLLDDVDLVVAPGMRIGLVGPNGAGKSTLLRALAGLHPLDGGEVVRAPRTATVGYLPQEADRRPDETVAGLLARRTGVAAAARALDAATADLAAGRPGADDRYAAALDRWLALGGADWESRAAAVLDGLGLAAGIVEQPTTTLSGGQAARVHLAALLVARFDAVLLDEPTNDLDDDGLDRLEAFVAGRSGPLVVVSHDRDFLARTVTAVVELDDHARTATRFDGGWGAFEIERARARRAAADAWARDQAQRRELVARARRQRQWATQGVRTALRRPDDNDKSIRFARAQGAERMLTRARRNEDALARLNPVAKPWESWELRLQIAAAGRSGDVVARLAGATVERGGFTLGPVDLEIRWGDRIAVVGPNGAGKSTLVGALLGSVPLAAGARSLGPGVVIGEIGQARDAFSGADPLLERFGVATDLGTGDARAALAKFGLAADHALRGVDTLSPGERTRAALAVLQARGVNCLVLDEPTNHLDLPALEQLEQALVAYDGTLLLVTHDRRLRAGVATTRTLHVEAGRVAEIG